jgi:hypothetical protein
LRTGNCITDSISGETTMAQKLTFYAKQGTDLLPSRSRPRWNGKGDSIADLIWFGKHYLLPEWQPTAFTGDIAKLMLTTQISSHCQSSSNGYGRTKLYRRDVNATYEDMGTMNEAIRIRDIAISRPFRAQPLFGRPITTSDSIMRIQRSGCQLRYLSGSGCRCIQSCRIGF